MDRVAPADSLDILLFRLSTRLPTRDTYVLMGASIVEKVRRVGRIKSEREYRIVPAYQDSMAADPGNEDEYSTLGALLDEFIAGRTPAADREG